MSFSYGVNMHIYVCDIRMVKHGTHKYNNMFIDFIAYINTVNINTFIIVIAHTHDT